MLGRKNNNSDQPLIHLLQVQISCGPSQPSSSVKIRASVSTQGIMGNCPLALACREAGLLGQTAADECLQLCGVQPAPPHTPCCDVALGGEYMATK